MTLPQVTQAIKRVSGAKDGWSAVAAGELLRLGGLNEQFALVADSLRRLYPDGEVLADALSPSRGANRAIGTRPRSQFGHGSGHQFVVPRSLAGRR